MSKSYSKNEHPGDISLGSLILDTIQKVITRTVLIGRRLPLPGEGNERALREGLKSQLLVKVLGWPDEQIRVGERFDILLLDEFNRPVITVETKAPYHRSSKEEQKTFRERLTFFTTLRTAYFTNGSEWDRLDLIAPDGQLTIHRQTSLEISQASPEIAETFFAPLRGDRYSEWGKLNRSLVSKSQPHILEGLARDLDSIVLDLTEFFSELFSGYEQGHAGSTIKDITRSIFNDWCIRSLQVPPQQVLNAIIPMLQDMELRQETLASVLRELGFTPSQASNVADKVLALGEKKRLQVENIWSTLWLLYHEQVKKLSAQSAHVLVARILLYRIGEDMSLFDPILGGQALETTLKQRKDTITAERTPALYILESVRRRMLNVLPIVYQLSDLDWWLVPEEKRSGMEANAKAFVEKNEQELEGVIISSLRIVDGYHFTQVDADVWQNVYQNYLPEEERQRIGGFYTPQEIVEFILDQAEYVPETEGLCQKNVIDPACGSGAFVNAAAARLLKHMEMSLPCHHSGHKKLTPKWEGQREILNTVLEHIHAVDTHPFAAFLTTLNLTFLILPIYANIRKYNPTFPLNFRVFAADSLDKPKEESLAPDMFEHLNSRIQLSAASYEKFRAIINKRFDLVCGNPPWGGVLKGPLAPVFEERKKQRFKHEYPNAATGKYDIYGLFIERGFQLLTDGGRFAMITQDTYLDKEWARGLRCFLSTKTRVIMIIDLNPFGQLFFKAMNTPAILIFDKVAHGKGNFVAVASNPKKFKGMETNKRRLYVLDTITDCLKELANKRRKTLIDFAESNYLPRQLLIDNASKRWSLTSRENMPQLKPEWFSIANVLEPRQGVTPGGCLDVFLISEKQATSLKLEHELIHDAIKSRETERWHVNWEGRVLLYPYVIRKGEVIPAFSIRHGLIDDSLDFENAVDDYERDLRRGRALDNNTAKDILEHRIALKLIKYPEVARYLVQSYTLLDGRIFEKKRFTQMGKRWYEYHRARDPILLLKKNRIVSPSLSKEVRFALDTKGFLADHACQYLLATDKTFKRREELRQKLSHVLGREANELDVLCYCLAFMNSQYAQDALVSGRHPTPKGSYQISEEYLKEIPVALPRTQEKAEEILILVKKLVDGGTPGHRVILETQLSKLVISMLSPE